MKKYECLDVFYCTVCGRNRMICSPSRAHPSIAPASTHFFSSRVLRHRWFHHACILLRVFAYTFMIPFIRSNIVGNGPMLVSVAASLGGWNSYVFQISAGRAFGLAELSLDTPLRAALHDCGRRYVSRQSVSWIFDLFFPGFSKMCTTYACYTHWGWCWCQL